MLTNLAEGSRKWFTGIWQKEPHSNQISGDNMREASFEQEAKGIEDNKPGARELRPRAIGYVQEKQCL